MSFRKDTGNRALNTVWVLTRVPGSWLHAVEDAAKSALYLTLDPFEWLGKTAKDIRTAVNNACKNGPRYHRLWKAPVSLVASPFMAIEWAAETLRDTWFNLFRNVRDTLANPFLNIWKSIQWMWKSKKIEDFKFSKIDAQKQVSPKNRLASLFK